MWIEDGGQVGIGVTNPGAKLDVSGSVLASTYYDREDSNYYVNPAGAISAILSGNVGIGTTSPTRILGIGGLVARNIGMERGTVADTAGFNLTINAGGATSAATDKNGGDILIASGTSTGSGFSSVKLQAVTAGASGTTDRIVTTHLEVGNSKIGFLGIATPVVRQTSGADLTNNVTSGGTDDTIADFTDLTTYATDAATIRNDIYQLSRKLKQVNDALRAYGLLT